MDTPLHRGSGDPKQSATSRRFSPRTPRSLSVSASPLRGSQVFDTTPLPRKEVPHQSQNECETLNPSDLSGNPNQCFETPLEPPSTQTPTSPERPCEPLAALIDNTLQNQKLLSMVQERLSRNDRYESMNFRGFLERQRLHTFSLSEVVSVMSAFGFGLEAEALATILRSRKITRICIQELMNLLPRSVSSLTRPPSPKEWPVHVCGVSSLNNLRLKPDEVSNPLIKRSSQKSTSVHEKACQSHIASSKSTSTASSVSSRSHSLQLQQHFRQRVRRRYHRYSSTESCFNSISAADVAINNPMRDSTRESPPACGEKAPGQPETDETTRVLLVASICKELDQSSVSSLWKQMCDLDISLCGRLSHKDFKSVLRDKIPESSDVAELSAAFEYPSLTVPMTTDIDYVAFLEHCLAQHTQSQDQGR